MGTKWTRSGIETLLINISEFTVAATPESGIVHERLEGGVAVVEGEEIRSLPGIYRRLKTLPFLRVLDLRWDPAC